MPYKCRGDCLRSFVFLFWPPSYKNINDRTHQWVFKTLNNVINCSMKHEMSMAYVGIYTHNKAYPFINYHQTIRICKILRLFTTLKFADSSAKTNTNSCQARILVNFTNVAPAHSSIQYRHIFWYHLIEETHSYRHVWTFSENIWNIYMKGLLKSVNFFWDAL